MVTRSGTAAPLVDPARHFDGRFEDRFARLSSGTIGVAGLVSIGIYYPQVRAEFHALDTWWSIASVGCVIGTSLLLSAGAFLWPRRWLNVINSVAAVTMLLSVLTWPLAFAGPTLSATPNNHDDVHPWVWGLYAVSAMSAAAVWSIRSTAAYIIVLSAGVAYVNALASANTGGLAVMAEDFIFQSTYAAMYCAMIFTFSRAGRTLDASIHASRVQAGSAAATQARTVERDRLDALIHDSIMSTLMNAAQHADDAVMVKQAKEALQQLGQLSGPPDVREDFDAPASVAHIRAASVQANDNAEFSSSVFRNAGPIPSEVVRAVSGATAEAVRNSGRHGNGARTRVIVGATASGLTVEVSDNGPGFDPASVPPDRLGLGISIIGRMSRIRGGSTAVRSAPGAGTVVTIGWQR